MAKKPNKQKSLASIYDSIFFEELFKMLSLKDTKKQNWLKKSVFTAASNYYSFYEDYLNYVPDHKAREELNHISKEMKNTKKRMLKLFKDQKWLGNVASTFIGECKQKHPELNGLITDIETKGELFNVRRPLVLLSVFDCLHETVDQTLKNYKKRSIKPSKSEAIEFWLTSFSSVLERILGRTLKQRRYETDQRGFIEKKGKTYDSDILFFILKPICRDATIAQIERALRDTKEERLNPPWEM